MCNFVLWLFPLIGFGLIALFVMVWRGIADHVEALRCQQEQTNKLAKCLRHKGFLHRS